MKILYIGPRQGPVSGSRRPGALRRLGHDVTVVDPRDALPRWTIVDWWSFHAAGLGLAWLVERHVLRQAGGRRFDVAFVDVGVLVSPTLVRKLKRIAGTVLCFNMDNPFTARDGSRWRLFLKALPEYDLVAFPRASSIAPAYARGARNVMQVRHAADELLIEQAAMSAEERKRFERDVVFVGTWMPERGPFMRRLIELGVPLRIFGPRWHKALEYPLLASHISPGPLVGADYAKTLGAANICLALLSKGNEDLYTSRSSEIPALGRVLCGERTADHLAMYIEDEEAVFFDTAEECAEKCLALLADRPRLERIAAAGHQRAIRNGTFAETQLRQLLEHATDPLHGTVPRS